MPSQGEKLPYTPLQGMSGDVEVIVSVYPHVGKTAYSDLSIGNTHEVLAQNVSVSWVGVDLPAVRAALDDLR